MTDPEPGRSLIPLSRSEREPENDARRRLALGVGAGAGLIAVAVGAGVLLVTGGIWLATLYLDHLFS